jgi:hypothetical protein
MTDGNRFACARQKIENGEDSVVAGIETMMELAFKASSSTLRRWARAYLRERFDVIVIEDNHEAETTTNNLSR